jgi:hypothetical protein
VAVLAAVSCIPDLASLAATGDAGGPDQVAADVAQPYCGDGIIQLEAGEQCDPGALADGATGAQGCTRDCRMDCDGGFVWNRNNHCYAEQAAADTILGAAQRCGVASPHVVTFASIDELTAVTTAIDAGAFWVGLQPDELQGGYYALAAYEPGWSTSCPGCFANTPVPTHPLPGDGGCVRGFVDLSRSWEAVGCADGGFHRLICEREPTGRQSTVCEAGVCIDLVVTSGMKRYVYVRDVASPDDAEQRCHSLGGTLVVLQSRDEREQLWKELSRLPGGGTPTVIWIGLSVAAGGSPDAGPWVWDDDAAADAYPSPWGNRQPLGGQMRAYLYQNGGAQPQLLDDTLGRNDTAKTMPTFPYVCQLPP